MRNLPPSVPFMEASIARAHRNLSLARDAASSLSDLGFHDDLQMLLIELERMQTDLLRSGACSTVRRRRSYVSQTQERP